MFSRRHPYLFFLLCMTAILSSTSVLVGLLTRMDGSEPDGEKIGVIEIVGMIAASDTIVEDIRSFREDDTIRAIVLRINSPGGGVGPSQEIHRAVEKAKAVKPVIASMGGLAASGGYYAAAPTDGIMANAGTVTGSIGVIMGYTNFRAVVDKLGLKPVVIKSGENKDIASPTKDLTPEQRKILQGFVDRVHHQFVRDVAAGRNLEEDVVEKLADGRIYSGERAMELGLVDRIGNFEDAMDWAAEKAGIPEGDWLAVYPPEDKPLVRQLIEGSSAAIADAVLEQELLSAGYLWKGGIH